MKTDITRFHPIVEIDPLLKPFLSALERRRRKSVLRELEFTDGKIMLKDRMNNHLYYGLHLEHDHWVFREKAPNARRIFLYGDFSAWQLEESFELQPTGNGDWIITLPKNTLRHGMLYKLWVIWDGGSGDRLPAYCRRVVQDDVTKVFSAQVWSPENEFRFQYERVRKHSFHYIYEAHIGMSSEKEIVSDYTSFRKKILPRIKELGYNTLQLMAIQEHPYYGSFGYQVANFYAPSSRFGTPEELKALIDEAHRLDIAVILDIVHSHSVSNEKEGLSHFDGREDLYFHKGAKGHHPVWDSRLFDYGKPETIAFLLSNIKYWMEEFQFDGLRFDGVTSMCYKNHGIGVDFLNYSQYFDDNVDEDAVVYLTLANILAKELHPDSILIAEDVSGMPGLAYPVSRGGVGFDYRMSMGIADFWTKTIEKLPDEMWHVGDIYFRLTDKRKEEHTISYAESHDQAMVGDKTIMFRLADKEMYSSMAISAPNLRVDRAVALHKIIRFLTLTLADGGYLNFMGNEFGHPEWIDFPREGNHWSYQHARRRWDLADDLNLKYHFLQDFDAALLHLTQQYDVFGSSPFAVLQNTADQTLVYKRGKMIFVTNLSPDCSFENYVIPVPAGEYRILLNSDNPLFGGFGNINESTIFYSYEQNGRFFIKAYLPARTSFALYRIDS